MLRLPADIMVQGKTKTKTKSLLEFAVMKQISSYFVPYKLPADSAVNETKQVMPKTLQKLTARN